MARSAPELQRRRDAEIQRLKNQGLTEDSMAFQRNMQRLDEGETDAFEVGYQEMLLVLCNNTFKQYLKELAKVRDAANRLKPAPEAPAKSGGCCRCLVQ
jgi:hypothetical protein